MSLSLLLLLAITITLTDFNEAYGGARVRIGQEFLQGVANLTSKYLKNQPFRRHLIPHEIVQPDGRKIINKEGLADAHGFGDISIRFRSSDQCIVVSVELVNVEMTGVTEVVELDSTSRSKQIRAHIDSLTVSADLKLQKSSEGFNLTVTKCRTTAVGIAGLIDEEILALRLNVSGEEMIDAAVCNPTSTDSLSHFLTSMLEGLNGIWSNPIATGNLSLVESTRIDDKFLDLTTAAILSYHDGNGPLIRLENHRKMPDLPVNEDANTVEIQLSQHIFTALHHVHTAAFSFFHEYNVQLAHSHQFAGLNDKLINHFGSSSINLSLSVVGKFQLEMHPNLLKMQISLPFALVTWANYSSLAPLKLLEGNESLTVNLAGCSAGCQLPDALMTNGSLTTSFDFQVIGDRVDLPPPLKKEFGDAIVKQMKPIEQYVKELSRRGNTAKPILFVQEEAIVLRFNWNDFCGVIKLLEVISYLSPMGPTSVSC